MVCPTLSSAHFELVKLPRESRTQIKWTSYKLSFIGRVDRCDQEVCNVTNLELADKDLAKNMCQPFTNFSVA